MATAYLFDSAFAFEQSQKKKKEQQKKEEN
jgi:hypothetical protein